MESETKTNPTEIFFKIMFPFLVADAVIVSAPLFCKPGEWVIAIILSIVAGILTYIFMDQFPM